MSTFNRYFKKKGKFGAVRTNGFASKLESAVYDILKLREAAGGIKDIKCQQSVTLLNVIRWKIDFSYVDVKTEKLVYVEAKGVNCATFKMKLKLYKSAPPAKLEIWRGSYQKPFLSEVIDV